MKKYEAASTSVARLLRKQDGKCPHCGLLFMPADRTETAQAIGSTGKGYSNLDLLHRHCLKERNRRVL
jgi:RNA-directed DNA polymerase